MGSLKDEMRGFKEEPQPCVETDDGIRGVSSGCSRSAEGQLPHTSQESTTGEEYQPDLEMNVSSVEERDGCPLSKDQVLSGVDNTEQSDSEQVKDCPQTNVLPVAAHTTAAQDIATISINFQNDGDPVDNNFALGEEKEADIENISVPVPLTADPLDPRSPAPFGQHHMRTQVSLEVVQCRSAATSPMTPPEGGHSFFFPSILGNSAGDGADTKDAELQVCHQVEFCSVATSPMTPKTPSTTAFPVLTGRETGQNKGGVEQRGTDTESGQQETLTAEENTPACVKDSQVSLEDNNQHCKQQRMGSMDQDITILVTHHGNNEEEEEEMSESYFYSTGPEVVKTDESKEVGGNERNIKSGDGNEKISAEVPAREKDESEADHSEKQPEEAKEIIKAKDYEARDVFEELTEAPVMKVPVPESPAPFGCHNIRTQVSLEVVQCQSAATSPMTPPQGEQAFYFPSSFGKCGSTGTDTKDAELQVGTQVEFRSVATAPMTPRTPVATTFPEIKKEASIEEKIVEEVDEEEDGGKQKQMTEDKDEVLEEVEEGEKEVLNGEEKCEEPIQEVSWDEKGMTWEVYGAVVEVAVLGSAIQKHLEKQVLKQKKQSSMPPPPPLNPSATPLTLEGGPGKSCAGKRREQDGKVSRRRRNPFRLMMENMQQPHCCSRAQTSE
ncbi:unnamed protein product [Menidia menidia]|uniref:(Atlantic silverside) hypothetical protein n=1 Tax=Menidia menidia TaxID=238744 RepID=A0A8S4BM67_9TELE|nr:unnamed protein product [Menidia menidia]